MSSLSIEQLKPGQTVEYHVAANLSTGKVVRVITEDEKAGAQEQHIHASKEHPRVIVTNTHTGKESALTLQSITRIVEEGQESQQQSQSQQSQQQTQQPQESQGQSKSQNKVSDYKVGMKVEYFPIGDGSGGGTYQIYNVLFKL